MTIAQTRPLILLGSGYTGEALLAAATGAGFTAMPTSRMPHGRTTAGGTSWIRFNLEDEATWIHLPPVHHYAWLFPAVPLEQVKRFAEQFDLRSRRVVVVGTTSSYLPEKAGADVHERRPGDMIQNAAAGKVGDTEPGGDARGVVEVDEDNVLDMTSDRVLGEEYLRSIGATVLRASGIYGPALGSHPARHPLSWLRRGMIASADSWVNLVHVSDLAAAVLEAMNRDLRGEQLIVSDGTPRRWDEIGDWAVRNGLMAAPQYSGGGRKRSKRLSNARLNSRLGPVLTHTDLFRELAKLEESQGQHHGSG